MRLVLIICLVSKCILGNAQITISDGTQSGISENTQINISGAGSISNNSTSFDLAPANVFLSLTGSGQNINGTWHVNDLELNGTSFTLNGSLTATSSIAFTSGIISVADDGKFLFTGAANLAGSPESYVNGFFYRTNGTPRSFPVGTNTFAPFIINNSVGEREIGVRFVDGDPDITITDDVDFGGIVPTGFWELATSDLPLNSPVSLYLPPFESGIPDDQEAIVVQRDGTTGSTLGYVASSDLAYVASEKPVTGTVVAVGTTVNVEVMVKDLITPYDNNDINHTLTISNIDSQRFSERKVTLLDRYGVFVESWEGDEVQVEINYDFRKLPPGNYICVVEYMEGTKAQKKLQMITILKDK